MNLNNNELRKIENYVSTMLLSFGKYFERIFMQWDLMQL